MDQGESTAFQPHSNYERSNLPCVEFGSVASHDPAAKARLGQRIRGPLTRIVFDLFCLAWIPPVVFAIVINLDSRMIGAGATCRIGVNNTNIDGGGGRPAACTPDHFLYWYLPEERAALAAKLDRDDRNLIGLLQIVAKVGEVWFSIVAASMVLDLAMWLAASDRGLPLGYLLAPTMFPDILVILKMSFWTAAVDNRPKGGRRPRAGVVCFLVVVVFLCIVCNLMGSAVAVLIIPHVEWYNRHLPVKDRFHTMGASQPPDVDAIEGACYYGPVHPVHFDKSCLGLYSIGLDELSAAVKKRFETIAYYGWPAPQITSDHNGLLFSFNSTLEQQTVGEQILWSPNRQVLEEMAWDVQEVFATEEILERFGRPHGNITNVLLANNGRPRDPALFDLYTNALDISLHRTGPSVGIGSVLCDGVSVFEQPLSPTTSVRCYERHRDADIARFYTCFRVGMGWNEAEFAHSRFAIPDPDIDFPTNLTVDIYRSSKSITMSTGNINAETCLDSTESPCDWSLWFSLDNGAQHNLTFELYTQQFVEYTLPRPSGANTTFLCYNVAYLDFLDYNVDMALAKPESLELVTLNTNATQRDRVKMSLHPDWILAAWLAPPFGTDMVDGTRVSAVNMVSAFKQSESSENTQAITSQHQISTLHALSLITYNMTQKDKTDAENSDNEKEDDGDNDDYDNHPLLPVRKSIRAWGFGVRTRTGQFAISICILGCVIVALRPVASLTIATRRPSPLRLMATALGGDHVRQLAAMLDEGDLRRAAVRVIHQGDNIHITSVQRD